MNDLFAVRSILEGAAAALAAKNLSDKDLAQLDQLAGVEYVVGEGQSTKSFVASNELFHAAIARGSNNSRLCSLIMKHLEEGTRFLYLGTRARDVNFETHSDHDRILAALRKRDGEAARHTMAEHTEHTRAGLLQALISQSEVDVTF